jgi:hypothetical protein
MLRMVSRPDAGGPVRCRRPLRRARRTAPGPSPQGAPGITDTLN